ncbi:hypothetical protein HPB51_023498 [Rhipicephalus microplus]|uniref:Uncharacterized protein n=1 Tax=Rhipicephalus microplus TaxID=6941 RepID=A0A9J6EK06_RHIMP|nr:hypothetical protein HPB51_023498 [Rhipicephalus microplus]
MDNSKKRDFRARKFASKNKYQGRRRKPKRKAAVEECEPRATRPNQGSGDTAACGNFDEIDAAIKFISASEKKIEQFESERTKSVCGSVSGVFCDIGALTSMVSRAVCPTCHTAGLVVRDTASKRKGLSSFLELHCDNSECPESVVSAAHSSRRVLPERQPTDAGDDWSYRSGSSRDSFAVNVKVYGRGFPGNYATSFSSVPGTARPPYTYSDSRVRGVRNAPDEDGYQRPAIISEKDLKGFDEILQNDSQDGWAAAKGDIDYNAKLVFSDEEDAGGSSRSAAPKGSDVVQVSESGKPVAMKGSEKGECRPPVPAGPKLPPSRSREPGWDASSGQQSAQQRTGREPPPTQTSAYMDREERGRKTWGAPGSAELQPQPPALSQQSQQAPSAQTAPVRQWPQSPQGAPPPAVAPVAAAPRATGAPPLDYLARGTPPPATTPPALAAAGFTSGRVGPPMPPQQSSHHSGFGGGPVAPSRGSSRQGLDQLTGDEEELWRQRRQQHNDEMAVTVERTRQRREEEEKRYEQIKQSSAATAAAANAAGQQQQQPQQQQPSVPDESTSVPAEKEDLDQRSCHSSESREEVRGGTLLPSRERPDFRQQPLGGYQVCVKTFRAYFFLPAVYDGC